MFDVDIKKTERINKIRIHSNRFPVSQNQRLDLKQYIAWKYFSTLHFCPEKNNFYFLIIATFGQNGYYCYQNRLIRDFFLEPINRELRRTNVFANKDTPKKTFECYPLEDKLNSFVHKSA